MRTATPIKIKNVPGILRNMRTTVRNVVRTPHFIVASMEKNSNTSRDCKVLKARDSDKDKFECGNKD